jgi:hypothetical protein
MAMHVDHVAFVVPELEPALAELSELFGLEWAPMPVVLHTHRPEVEAQDFSLRLAKSVHHPRIEIIEAVPDSPWAFKGTGAQWEFNHIAFDADDLRLDSERLSKPCPLVACGMDEDETIPSLFAFHDLHGVMFELRDLTLYGTNPSISGARRLET